jgi:tripartite-type tricarboxylate transporter receptor subunit TctC
LFAPAGTPAAVLDRLHASVTKAMATPAIQSKLVELGLQYAPMTRSEAEKVWMTSIQKTSNMLQQLKLGSQ